MESKSNDESNNQIYDYNSTNDYVNETSGQIDELSFSLKVFYSKFPVQSWKNLGYFDELFLKTINEHWLLYEPASKIVHHSLALIYSLILIVGCTGNFLVLFMFLRCKSLRTPANYFIFNLALSDFLMIAKTPIFIYNSYYEGPALGAIGCSIYGFVGGLTGTGSIMTLATIALDRYSVILNPLNPVKKTTKGRAVGMIGGIWLYSAFFSSLPLFKILNSYVPEGLLTSCSFDYLDTGTLNRAFIFIFFLAAWFVPLSIITFSYLSIFNVVLQAERFTLVFQNDQNRSSASTTTGQESFKARRRHGKQRREIKIAILTSVLVTFWVFAWTPYAIVALLGIFGQKTLLSPLVSALPALFCKSSACINPFVYAINHPRFQRELRDLLQIGKCSKRCRRPSMREEGGINSSEIKETAYVSESRELHRINSPLSIIEPEERVNVNVTRI